MLEYGQIRTWGPIPSRSKIFLSSTQLTQVALGSAHTPAHA